MTLSMDQSLVIPAVDAAPTGRRIATNLMAHAASKIGIIGAALLLGVIGLAVSTFITALTTPDFMPDADADPFAQTCVACFVPLVLGCIGLAYGIAGLRGMAMLGERRVAIRGFVLALVNILLPIGIGILFFNFDIASAACGGG